MKAKIFAFFVIFNLIFTSISPVVIYGREVEDDANPYQRTSSAEEQAPSCSEVEQYNECISCNTSKRVSKDSCGNFTTVVDSQEDSSCTDGCSAQPARGGWDDWGDYGVEAPTAETQEPDTPPEPAPVPDTSKYCGTYDLDCYSPVSESSCQEEVLNSCAREDCDPGRDELICIAEIRHNDCSTSFQVAEPTGKKGCASGGETASVPAPVPDTSKYCGTYDLDCGSTVPFEGPEPEEILSPVTTLPTQERAIQRQFEAVEEVESWGEERLAEAREIETRRDLAQTGGTREERQSFVKTLDLPTLPEYMEEIGGSYGDPVERIIKTTTDALEEWDQDKFREEQKKLAEEAKKREASLTRKEELVTSGEVSMDNITNSFGPLLRASGTPLNPAGAQAPVVNAITAPFGVEVSTFGGNNSGFTISAPMASTVATYPECFTVSESDGSQKCNQDKRSAILDSFDKFRHGWAQATRDMSGFSGPGTQLPMNFLAELIDDPQKALELAIPYGLLKKASELPADIEKVDNSLRDSGVEQRAAKAGLSISYSSQPVVSLPEVKFNVGSINVDTSNQGLYIGGYGVTVNRALDLQRDIEMFPDSTLTLEEQEKRRQYAKELGVLFNKEQNLAMEWAATTALAGAPSVVSKATPILRTGSNKLVQTEIGRRLEGFVGRVGDRAKKLVGITDDTGGAVYTKLAEGSENPVRFGQVYEGGGEGEFNALTNLYQAAPDTVAKPIGVITQNGRVIGYKMEKVEGVTALEYIQQHGSLPKDIQSKIGQAVSDLHAKGLAHGDLNPGNVIITPAGKVKLIDPVGYTHFEGEYASSDLQTLNKWVTKTSDDLDTGVPVTATNIRTNSDLGTNSLSDISTNPGSAWDNNASVYLGPDDMMVPFEYSPQGIFLRGDLKEKEAKALIALQEDLNSRPHMAPLSVTDVPRPLRSNEMDSARAKVWVESHPDAESKAVAQAVVDNTHHVDQRTFEAKLAESIEDFNRQLPAEEGYTVMVQGGKSNKWVAELGAKDLAVLPDDSVDLARLGMMPALPEKNIVLFDDASYSGSQLRDYVNDVATRMQNPDGTIYVVAPYMTKEAERKIGQAAVAQSKGIKVVVVKHEVMPAIADDITDPVIQEGLRKMYGGAAGAGDPLTSRTLTYFDHKVPDDWSTLSEVYNGGVVKDINGNVVNNGGRKFVPLSNGPYKDVFSVAPTVRDIETSMRAQGAEEYLIKNLPTYGSDLEPRVSFLKTDTGDFFSIKSAGAKAQVKRGDMILDLNDQRSFVQLNKGDQIITSVNGADVKMIYDGEKLVMR